MDKQNRTASMNLTKAQLLELVLAEQAKNAALQEQQSKPVTPPEAVQQPSGALIQVETRVTTNQAGEENRHRQIVMEAGEIFYCFDEEGTPIRVSTWQEATIGCAFLPNYVQRYIAKNVFEKRQAYFESVGVTKHGKWFIPVERGGENKAGWIIGSWCLRIRGEFMGKPMVIRVKGSLGTNQFLEGENVMNPALPRGWTTFTPTVYDMPNDVVCEGMSTVYTHLRMAIALATGPWFSFGTTSEDTRRPSIDTPFVKEFKGRFISLCRKSGASQDKLGSVIEADQFTDFAQNQGPATGPQTVANAASGHNASMARPKAMGQGW